MPDILVIVPDVPYECLIRTVERSHLSIGIGRFIASIHRIPTNDSGVRKHAHERAREERARGSQRERYALAVLDYKGAGAKGNATSCARGIEENLANVTFSNCCKAICVDPEIEALLLSSPISFADSIGLNTNDFQVLLSQASKRHPGDLGEQVRWILKRASRRNHNRYELRDVIDGISLNEMLSHPSFSELVTQLREWFPSD